MNNLSDILITLSILFLILFIIQIIDTLKKSVNEKSVKNIDVNKLKCANRQIVQNSKLCGCFNCLKIFTPDKIQDDDWVDMKDDEIPRPDDTPLCPYCGIDSIIGDASDCEITEELLKVMHKSRFS